MNKPSENRTPLCCLFGGPISALEHLPQVQSDSIPAWWEKHGCHSVSSSVSSLSVLSSVKSRYPFCVPASLPPSCPRNRPNEARSSTSWARRCRAVLGLRKRKGGDSNPRYAEGAGASTVSLTRSLFLRLWRGFAEIHRALPTVHGELWATPFTLLVRPANSRADPAMRRIPGSSQRQRSDWSE